MLTAQDIRKLEQNYTVTSDEYKLIGTLWKAMELLETIYDESLIINHDSKYGHFLENEKIWELSDFIDRWKGDDK